MIFEALFNSAIKLQFNLIKLQFNLIEFNYNLIAIQTPVFSSSQMILCASHNCQDKGKVNLRFI